MPYYEQTESGQLVPIKGELPLEAITEIERADEKAIIESFAGGFAQEHLLYSYPIKTKEGKKLVVGISVDGAKEIARLLGNIEVLPDVKVQEREEYFYGIIRVKDLIRNVTLAGFGRQSIYILGESNEPTDRRDELAYVKALSKAQRNGILSVAPQEAVAKIVQQFIEQKKLGRLAPPKTELPQTQQPSATPAAPPAKQESRNELNKIKAAFMMKWREFASYMKWDETNSESARKQWLHSTFTKDSLTELTLDELSKALGKLDGEIANAVSASPPSETEVAPGTVDWSSGGQEVLEKGKEEVKDEPATVEEERAIAKALMEDLGKSKEEVRQIVHEVTQKKKDWTKSDMKKVWEYIEKLKGGKEKGSEAEGEAQDFLQELDL